MSLPLASASKRTQVILTGFIVISWSLIGIVWLGLLPRNWRFDHWPTSLQAISIMVCVLYFIADALFAAWYFLALVVDAYGGKSDRST
jgi:hypothetical protein